MIRLFPGGCNWVLPGRSVCYSADTSEEQGEIGGVDAAYVYHPSLLAIIPGDISPVVKPMSVAVGEKDSLLDLKSVEQIRAALIKTGVPAEVKIYDDQIHGFALRSDWSSDKDKQALDNAKKQGIEWSKKYLF